MQWFLSESRWDPKEVNERRLELSLEEPATAANDEGALVIDEHGDRKWGKKTRRGGESLRYSDTVPRPFPSWFGVLLELVQPS